MAKVVLFRHAQGLTCGITAFAEVLRRAGHAVHTPGPVEGRSFFASRAAERDAQR